MSRGIHTLPNVGGGGGSSAPPPITRFEQVFASPTTTWTVHHPLGTDAPFVQLYDLSGAQIGGDIDAPDTATVIVTFARPVAGRVAVSKG